MKSIVIAVLFSGFLCGQTPQPIQVTPGTPAVKAPTPAPPPAPAADMAPDTVVIEVNGKKFTKAEIDRIIAALPPQIQQTVHTQPQFLTNFFVMKRLAEDAEKTGLDKQAPYKDALEFNRIEILSRAELNYYSSMITLTAEEQEKYYKDNPDKYRQAKVRVIYISFNPTPDKALADGKKLLTEAEAKTKIDDLRKQIEGGVDFGKLAKENSEDKTSAAKDGDFGIIKHSSPYPDPIKNAVFALKSGEVSQPVKQPNGFYLIRLDELTMQPYDEVSSQIFQDVRQQRFNDWTKGLQTQYTVKVENPAYFTPKVPAQLQQVR